MSDALASSLPVAVDIIWFSVQAGVVKKLEDPGGVSVPLSALPLPEDSTALFQRWYFNDCGLRPRCFPSCFFLRPRAQLQLSTSICVPHLEGIRGAFDVPPLVPHIICEMSPQLGASYSSPRDSGVESLLSAPHLVFYDPLFTTLELRVF